MKRALLVPALLLALLGSGCGGADTLALDAVANAADRTAAQKSARFDMSIQLTMPAMTEPLRMFGTGAFDEESGRARLEMDFTELMSSLGAPAGSMKMEMLFDHPVVYMRLPPQALAEVGSATPWVKIDLSKATGVDPASLGQFSRNPADQLDMLRAVSGSVVKKGTKSIRGITTTHYHASVDVKKALDAGLKSLGGPQAREALDAALAQGGLDQIPLDVWLDDAGVVHRMVMDMRASADGHSFRMVMTMDLYDFGARVDVGPPPPSQVTDVTAQALQGG